MTEPTPSDEEVMYPPDAVDHALKWADEQKNGPPGFWNDLRVLAWAYRLAKSEQERFERLFLAETRARSRGITNYIALEARLAEAKADIVAESAKRDKCIDTINIQMDRAEKAAASLAEMTKDLSASREREAQRQEKIGAWLAWYKDDGPEKEYADGHLLWNELLEALSPSGPGGKEEGS